MRLPLKMPILHTVRHSGLVRVVQFLCRNNCLTANVSLISIHRSSGINDFLDKVGTSDDD